MLTQTFPQTFLKGRVEVKIGDITVESADAIVNAANSTLLGGGGVDGAIHRRGGKSILEECKKVRRTQYPDGLPAGEAVATVAGDLPAKYVIHTVGPIWKNGKSGEAETLKKCYMRSLECGLEKGCKTIAFPAISTGVYGFPKELAAEVSSKAIAEFLRMHETVVRVILVFFSGADAHTFLAHHKF